MTITYNKSNKSISNYRKIYEQYYGPIPVDEDGRSFDIHHIDGNHNNNDINNLIAVSIREHYDIHYREGNYGACYCILRRLTLTPEEISEAMRKQQYKLLEEGRHNFQLYRLSADEQSKVAKSLNERLLQEGKHPFQDPVYKKKALEHTLKTQKILLENGTHIFSSGDLQRKIANKRVKDGTHPLLGPTSNLNRLKAGTHPSQVI